jgi:uncharacterized protein YyaL (SSP411 family)
MKCSLPALLVFGLSLSGTLSAEQDKGDKAKPRPTNRLARETSPYLLMHQHNPVDWFPWGPDAFAKARKENKLVFLSIGYSSCYWCHVMERESFSNPAVAKLLNDWFVAVKVDREERPDVDHIYMTSLQELGRGGGWPLSMFLTPDGRPIVGGTYWPPEDRKVGDEVSHGFKSLLKIVHEYWDKDPKQIEKQADKLAAATTFALAGPDKLGIAVVELNRELVNGAVEDLRESFDKEYGGFGSALRKFRGPKFPLPSRLQFLFEEAERTNLKELREIVTLTLDQMAQGGIYDQLGGGFHRYSTERTWTVPHFEKMLYDNALLVELYAQAYRLTNNPLYRRVVEETLEFVGRELTSPEGGFYSSLDAETDEEEGRFYVWTDKEIDTALPQKADADLVRKVFGADGKPNFEGKYHIFTRRRPLAEVAKELNISEREGIDRLGKSKQVLFEARAKRPRPFRNVIALTSWSGLMIAGYAEAGRSLKEPRYTERAVKAAEFVLQKQKTKDGRLLRTYGAQPGQKAEARVNAYLEDYSFLVHGLLTLHDVTGDKKWLQEARGLTDAMIRWYGDPKRGGYYFTPSDGEKFFARPKDQYDGAYPSGNSVAARNLVRLAARTGEARYGEEARKCFQAFAGSLKRNPSSLTAMAQALSEDLQVKAR